MKKMLIIAISGLLLCSMIPVFAATTGIKLGIVNIRALLLNSKRFTQIQKTMNEKIVAEQTKLQKSQEAIQAEYANVKPNMNKKEKAALKKKIAKDRASLQAMAKGFQDFSLAVRKQYIDPVDVELKSDIQEIAKQKSLDLVLPSSSVLYSADSYDITEDVAKKFG